MHCIPDILNGDILLPFQSEAAAKKAAAASGQQSGTPKTKEGETITDKYTYILL